MPFAASVGLGLALRFLVPIPAGITLQAWSLLSIFVSAIAGATSSSVPPQTPWCLQYRCIGGFTIWALAGMLAPSRGLSLRLIVAFGGASMAQRGREPEG